MSMAAENGGKARGRASARSLVARFLGNRDGATVIEFTVLAIPFALLVFAILESCISFAAQQLLANATDNVARQLRTGQILASDIDQPKLRTLICDQIELLVGSDCPNSPNLQVDLEQYATFADAAKVQTRYTSDGDLDTTGFGVNPGGSMSKNMLRVYYKWPIMTDFMRKSMSNLKDGKTLLFATDTWQNEPF
jgi:Flp pilus assembly protein TadG